jgi:hypothetical protein
MFWAPVGAMTEVLSTIKQNDMKWQQLKVGLKSQNSTEFRLGNILSSLLTPLI